jgi:hypothetical protein
MVQWAGSMQIQQRVTDAQCQQMVECLLLTAIQGVPQLRLHSAQELALDYKNNPKFKDTHQRVRHLIRWETSKNFSTGFITGLGGLITLPITLPAALGASWMLQARLAAAVAYLYGYDLESKPVQTMTLLCLLGDSAVEMVKKAGVRLGAELTEQALAKISAETLLQINKQVGFKLLARAGESGLINFSHVVPIAGGIVGGTVDAVACRMVGHTAVKVFGNVDICSDIVDAEII